jgi:hypothetical protein
MGRDGDKGIIGPTHMLLGLNGCDSYLACVA